MIFYRFIAIFSSYSYQIVIQTMKKRASFAAPSNMFFYQSHIPQTILSSIPREETPILSLSSPIFYTPSTMADTQSECGNATILYSYHFYTPYAL